MVSVTADGCIAVRVSSAVYSCIAVRGSSAVYSSVACRVSSAINSRVAVMGGASCVDCIVASGIAHGRGSAIRTANCPVACISPRGYASGMSHAASVAHAAPAGVVRAMTVVAVITMVIIRPVPRSCIVMMVVVRGVVSSVVPRIVPSPSPSPSPGIKWPVIPAPAVSPRIMPTPSPVVPVVPVYGAVVAVAVSVIRITPVPCKRIVPGDIPRIHLYVYNVCRAVKFSKSCLIALIVICNDVGCLRVVFYIYNVFVPDKYCVCICGLCGENVIVGFQNSNSPCLELINILIG